MEQQFLIFKDTVFKLAVLWKVQRLTGGYRSRKTLRDDNEMYHARNDGVMQEGLLATRISYLGGVIDSEHVAQFKRFIVRATRCQVFVHSFELHLHREDQIIGDNYDERKSIFVLAFQDGSVLEDKIRRICNSFPGEIYEVKLDGIDEEIQNAQRTKEQTREIIRETKNVFKQFLISANIRGDTDVSVFKVYKVFISKEKTIYTYLNML